MALCYWLPLSVSVTQPAASNKTPASAAHNSIDCYLEVFFDQVVFFIFTLPITMAYFTH